MKFLGQATSFLLPRIIKLGTSTSPVYLLHIHSECHIYYYYFYILFMISSGSAFLALVTGPRECRAAIIPAGEFLRSRFSEQQQFCCHECILQAALPTRPVGPLVVLGFLLLNFLGGGGMGNHLSMSENAEHSLSARENLCMAADCDGLASDIG